MARTKRGPHGELARSAGRPTQNQVRDIGARHPGVFTLQTSRGGSEVLAAYANLQRFGQVGLRVLLGHLVEMAESLREHPEGHDCITIPPVPIICETTSLLRLV